MMYKVIQYIVLSNYKTITATTVLTSKAMFFLLEAERCLNEFSTSDVTSY